MITRPCFTGRLRLAALTAVGALASSLIVPILASTASAAGAAGVPPGGTAGGLGPPNTWVATGQMGAARSGQTATLLTDGKVLIAGGGTARSELYDPATRTFSPAGNLPVAVTQATATLLPDGKVLVAGGLAAGHQVKNAELYDPGSGTWSATGPMNKARSGQTATLLPNGTVLVAGGGCNGSGYGCDSGSFEAPQRTAEIYDPATGTWSLTGSMTAGRQFFTATLLRTGDVLAVGGFSSCDDDFCSENKTAELYHPATGTWSATGSMHSPREQHTATLLPDGRVLVTGGLNEGGFSSGPFRYASAELYDPATGTWGVTASMAARRAGATATLLGNGWVLVAGGGTATAEIYQPRRAVWVSPGAMSTIRTGHTATLLPGGHVLVTGGSGPDGQPLATAEEFLAGRGPLVTIAPGSIAFGGQQVGSTSGFRSYRITNLGSAGLVSAGVSVTGRNPGDFRASTTCTKATVPPGGTCLVRVRFAPTATNLRTAQVGVSDNAPGSPHGTPVTGSGIGPYSWAPTGDMSSAREEFAATLLPDGKVLVAGGESNVANSLATAELYDPATRSFTPTGSLGTARDRPAATLLESGMVLITGGLTSNFTVLSSAELYDPASGTWAPTTSMNAAGYGLTSTLLPDGDVLVTGFGGANAAEVYHPATATWTNTGPLRAAQGFATATLLRTGKVLLAGGGTTAAELYDPASNTWALTGSMTAARQGHTATLLPDGDVLVAGGVPAGGGNAQASTELYHPATGTWTAANPMRAGRYGATATLLPNGMVLVAGGCTAGCGNLPGLASAEIYTGGFFEPVASMTQPRVFGRATLLPDGTVLQIGGGTSYDSPATATAEFFTATLLSLSPASGPAGAQATASGSGFYAGERVTLSWDGGVTVLGHAKTDSAGTFTTKITIPSGAAAGRHQVSVQGRRSFAAATATFTVTG